MTSRIRNRKMSTAQVKTLGALIAAGGEMNSYTGQRGFYCASVNVLHRQGYVTEPVFCEGSHGDYTAMDASGAQTIHPHVPCTVEHTELADQKGGRAAYGRISITEAGRAAYAAAQAQASDNALVPVATPVVDSASAEAPVRVPVPVPAAPTPVAPVIVVKQGDRVRRAGIRGQGQVLEIGKRAGVVVVAVAFGVCWAAHGAP